MGDRILRTFVARLKQTSRAEDIVGRHEGDTFLYLIDTDVLAGSAGALATRLVLALSFEAQFGPTNLRLAPTIGLATSTGSGTKAREVLEAAKSSLVQAKQQRVPLLAQAVTAANALNAGPASGSASEAQGQAALGAGLQTDRRRHPRQRVFKQGQIILDNSVIDCAIRDVSLGGARLRLNGEFAVPERFDLAFVGAGKRKPVRVRWQIGRDLGVEYVT